MSNTLKFPKAIEGKPAVCGYEFGPFRLDVTKRLVLRDGEPLALSPRLFETLLALVENSGRLVEKDELMTRLWPDTVVEEANLTVNVSALRKTLGQKAGEHRYIITVPGRGYRFVADVKEIREEDKAALENRTGAKIGEEQIQNTAQEQTQNEEAEQAVLPALKDGIAPSHAPASVSRRGKSSWKAIVIPIFLFALIGLIGFLWIFGKLPKSPAAVSPRSIAVLPFKLLSGNDGEEYLGAGMADALITRLGSIKGVNVRPTSAVLKYNRLDEDPVAAGRELNVEAVLEGSIRQSGARVRVTVQLVSVESTTPIWTAMFDEKATDVFTVEDRVSERLVNSLRLKLSGEEKERLARRYTNNTEAYATYLRGRFHWNKRTPDGIKKAIEHFNQAIALDSNFALAHAGLADCYVLLGFRTYSSLPAHETMPKAKMAALKALEIDDTLAEAHASSGLVKMRYEYDWEGAELELKRAIELNPGYATAHQWYADYLFLRGRPDEAKTEIKLAQDADPSALIINSTSALQAYYGRDYDQALQQCREILDLNPDFYVAYLIMGLAYEEKGRHEEAIAEIRNALPVLAGGTGESYTGYVNARAGRSEQSLESIARLKQLSKQTYVSPIHIALIYSGLRQADQTIEWLEKAYDDRSTAMVYLRADPKYDWLRSDSRFQDLLRRIGL